MDILGRLLEQLLSSPSAWAGFIFLGLIVVAMIVLGIMLLKAIVPVSREFGDLMDTISKNFQAQREGMEAQRQSWQALIDEARQLQERREEFYKSNIKTLTDELGVLRKQYAELSRMLEARDRELVELRRQINNLEKEDEAKTREIETLRKERDELSKKVDTLSKQIEEMQKEKKTT